MTIKIKLKNPKNLKVTKPRSKEIIDVIIPNKYLQLFNGCWLKYSPNSLNTIESGGFMYNFCLNIISLKIPRTNQEIHLEACNYTFYCNPELPQYKSMCFLLKQEQKLERMIKRYTLFIIKNNIT